MEQAIVIFSPGQGIDAEREKACGSYFFPGCHRMEPYRTLSPGYELPQTERIAERVLALPTGTAVGHAEVELVAAVIRSSLHEAPAIRRMLSKDVPLTW